MKSLFDSSQYDLIQAVEAKIDSFIELSLEKLPMADITEEQRRRQLLQQRLGGQDGDFIMKRIGSSSTEAGDSLTRLLAHSLRHSLTRWFPRSLIRSLN